MIQPEKVEAIYRLIDDFDIEERVRRVASLETGAELQLLANKYNWDDGFALPTAIADHPNCDLGVALTLFWLAEAQSWYTGEIEPSSFNADWVEFCRLISNRIQGSYYAPGPTGFEFDELSRRKYQRLGIPDVFLVKVESDARASDL